MRARSILRFFAVTLLFLGVVPFTFRSHPDQYFPFTGSHVRIIICTGKEFPHLSSGYVYDLVRHFLQDDHFSADIVFARDSSYVDSLHTGAADLLAIHASPGLEDSLRMVFSVALPGNYVLAVPQENFARILEINRFLHRERAARGYSARLKHYMHPYYPGKPGPGSYLGPYDELFKREAARIGWDWRLLAAIAYKESKFHIEAQSRKGAQGIMQLIPVTAARFGAEDPVDPAQSITASANYLAYLERFLARKFESLELERALVLASYNAGEGQILRCLQAIDPLHASVSLWETVIQTIPSVEGFKGTETIAYVEDVMELYEDIKRFLPSSQDQPAQ